MTFAILSDLVYHSGGLIKFFHDVSPVRCVANDQVCKVNANRVIADVKIAPVLSTPVSRNMEHPHAISKQ